MQTSIQLVVGLGNPGPKYVHTRHNAGADLVYRLAQRENITLKTESRFFGETGRATLAGQDVRLLSPSTVMSRSGQAVGPLARFYSIPVEAILVVHDELDLPPGRARFKHGGGHGGHNGLRDLIEKLGSNAFARLRLGIGHPGHASEVVNYVLHKGPPEERSALEQTIEDALDALPAALRGDWNSAMRTLHTR